MKLKQFCLLFLLATFSACGSVKSVSQGDADLSIIPQGTEAVIFFATQDFQSEGQILTTDFASPSTIKNVGVTGLGSSAIIRVFNKKIYVLHDGASVGSYNNVDILDPINGTRTQWSTGAGSNPHDIVVVGDKAYITLYSPEFGGNSMNVNADGDPIDVRILDLNTGNTVKGLSFQDFLNPDSSRTARADQMVRVGNRLYVCLQDLEGNGLLHNAPGKIGVINLETDTIEGVITLQGRDPTDIVYSASEQKLYVAHQAPYQNGGYDTSDPYGGIEIVPLNDVTHTVLIPDDNMGGYVERLESTDDRILGVVSQFDVLSFDFTSDIVIMDAANTAEAGVETLVDGAQDVRHFAVDSQDRLWVTTRAIRAGDGQTSSAAIKIFDLDSGDQIGNTLFPSISVTTIAFGTF